MTHPSDIQKAPASLSSDDAAAVAASKDRKKRRAFKRHGGHEELNIYSMLDLMTIILVFLIKQWQSDSIQITPDVSPPASTITEKPTECIRVFISGDRIVLDDKEVARLEGGQVVPGDIEGYTLPRLQAAMEDRAEQFLKIEKAGGAKFEGKYAIVADRKVPWSLLKKILYTAGQASSMDEDGLERSFGDVRLITKSTGGEK